MDYNSEQQKDYEINSNPELQRNELNPSVSREVCVHEKVYKTLVTLGDFICYVWFHDNNYDDSRTAEGSKRIHIVPSESRKLTVQHTVLVDEVGPIDRRSG